jgi:glycine/D-amino acid oxidase-like deaminating enzyme
VQLPERADAVVVGGGVMGASAAFHLAEAGVDVVLFERAEGFSGHGFLQGPAVGEILRDLVLEQKPFLDVGPLSAERFAAGSTRPERNVV